MWGSEKGSAQPPLVLVQGHSATSSFISCVLKSVTGHSDVAGTDPRATVPVDGLGEPTARGRGEPWQGAAVQPARARLLLPVLWGCTDRSPRSALPPGPRQPRALHSCNLLFPPLLPAVDLKSQQRSRFFKNYEMFQTYPKVQQYLSYRLNQC